MNLSIKDVPEELVERLREQAKANHRSLQGELMTLLEEQVQPKGLTVDQLAERARARHLNSPSESTQIVREMRDARERELYERVTGQSFDEPSTT